jgi:hypothetical protein
MIRPSFAQTSPPFVTFIAAALALRARNGPGAGQVPSPLAPCHVNSQKKYQAHNSRNPNQEHEIPNTEAEQLGRPLLRGQAVRQGVPRGGGKKQDPV